MKALLKKSDNGTNGYLLILVLIFGSVFFIIITSFIGYIIAQSQLVNFRYEQQRATEIAEAGLNYYKWHLSHFPGDVMDGTGVPGPYIHTFKDFGGVDIGEFSLEIASTTYCGSVSSLAIESTAFTYKEPNAVSVVRAKYSRPTVAEYSFISNDGVWFGSDEVVVGPLHSNQGIKMDAYHNSIVGSGQASWTCGSGYGCSPSKIVDGVYKSPLGNSTPGLFTFPVSPIDFAGLTLDLNDMKTRARDNGGIYLGPSGAQGYYLKFKDDGTIEIKRVTGTHSYTARSSAEGEHTERNVIANSVNLPTKTINPSCPLLYIEDKIWIEGKINQKVTVAAANLALSTQTNVVIQGSIEYVSGSDAGLLVIAEDDIDLGVQIPDVMKLYGIYIAQKGRFGRNQYKTSWFTGTLDYLDPYVKRSRLDKVGTIVSNTRAVTAWVDGSGNVLSGIVSETTAFDRALIDNPPPLTPETSDVYSFSDWRHN